MIRITDIYKDVTTIIQDKYHYKIYGHEVVEGFDKPSFFIELIPKKNSNETINYKEKAYTILITYFQKKRDDVDNYQKADEIVSLFGYKLKVSDSYLPITDASYEFIGEKRDILQVSIEIEFQEKNEKIDTNQVATELKINEEMR